MIHDSIVYLSSDVVSTALFVAVGVVSVSLLLLFRHVAEALFFAVGTPLLMVSVTVIKEFLQVARPEGGLVAVSGYGFPSGHGAGVMFMAVGLYLLFLRHTSSRVRIILSVCLGIVVALVGASRVYIGVHTPIQVLGGYLLGFVIALLLYWAIRNVDTKRRHY